MGGYNNPMLVALYLFVTLPTKTPKNQKRNSTEARIGRVDPFDPRVTRGTKIDFRSQGMMDGRWGAKSNLKLKRCSSIRIKKWIDREKPEGEFSSYCTKEEGDRQ